MDANRYFEEMHKAMNAPQAADRLLLSVKYQDAAGADAYLELHRDAAGTARVVYTTMGRKYLSFQLLRTGWQLCHNTAGELIEHRPAGAEELIRHTDFRAFCRSEAFDEAKAARIERELVRLAGTWAESGRAQIGREGSRITVESYVGAGAHWSYSGQADERCLPAAAIVYWLADCLAGNERRALQADPRAAHFAEQWDLEAEFSNVIPLSRPACTPGRTRAQAYAARARVPGKNERWQSFLSVMAAV